MRYHLTHKLKHSKIIFSISCQDIEKAKKYKSCAKMLSFVMTQLQWNDSAIVSQQQI